MPNYSLHFVVVPYSDLVSLGAKNSAKRFRNLPPILISVANRSRVVVCSWRAQPRCHLLRSLSNKLILSCIRHDRKRNVISNFTIVRFPVINLHGTAVVYAYIAACGLLGNLR